MSLLERFAKKRKGVQSNWRWHMDEVFVKIDGELHYLWRAIDHEGEVLECFVSKRRNKAAALKFLKTRCPWGETMKKHGAPYKIVTDKLRSEVVQIRTSHSDEKKGRCKSLRIG